MLKDFNTFINEAITLKKDGGAHFLERVESRLNNLQVVRLVDKAGKPVQVSNFDLAEIQKFYQKAFSQLADARTSKVFADSDVKNGHIGLIRLGKAEVKLDDGTLAYPVFKVYERTDPTKNAAVYRTGKYFWIFTVGSEVSTIKLYDIDGESKSDKSIIMSKSIEHLTQMRQAELAKISRVFNVQVSSKEDLTKIHQIILNPAKINKIELDLGSKHSAEDQLDKFIHSNRQVQKETIQMIPLAGEAPSFDLSVVPKQMNVTPEKVWLLEFNAKFNTWGAMPILSSKQIKGLTGNEVQVKLGNKWVHWLDSPRFNAPMPSADRVLKRGDRVTLGKELGNGDWLINTGTISEISTDSSSSKYPYVKTNGWEKTEVIDAERAKTIFKREGVRENYNYVLSFSEWSINQ